MTLDLCGILASVTVRRFEDQQQSFVDMLVWFIGCVNGAVDKGSRFQVRAFAREDAISDG